MTKTAMRFFFFWRIKSQPAGSSLLLALPNAPNPEFRPRVEGEYKFGLVVNDSLANSAEDEVVITAIANYTPIDQDTRNNLPLKTYPNPAKDQLTVDYCLTSPGTGEISIFDISGHKLVSYLTDYQNEGSHIYKLKLDSKQFKKGLYFIVLKTTEGSFSDRFIVE